MARGTEGDEHEDASDMVSVTSRKHAMNILFEVMGSLNDGHARYPIPELGGVYDFLANEIREPLIGNTGDYPRWGVRVNVFGIDSKDMAHTYSSSRWIDEAVTRDAADVIAERVVDLYAQDVIDEVARMVIRTGEGEQDDISGEISVDQTGALADEAHSKGLDYGRPEFRR